MKIYLGLALFSSLCVVGDSFVPSSSRIKKHPRDTPVIRTATETRKHATQVNVSKDGHHSISDSFNLVVFGDLHMEDDMTRHEESRSDCIAALGKLSLLPSGSSKGENVTVAKLIAETKNTAAHDLTLEQLEMLLEQKRAEARGDAEGILRSHLVSLGDLGRKDIRHEPGDAGTTKSFEDARKFFDGFGLGKVELVSGNHDLEGMHEFVDSKMQNNNIDKELSMP